MRQHKMTLPRLQTQCRCCHFFKNNYFIWLFRLNAEVLTHKNLSLNVSGEGAKSPDVTDFSLNFQLSRSL